MAKIALILRKLMDSGEVPFLYNDDVQAWVPPIAAGGIIHPMNRKVATLIASAQAAAATRVRSEPVMA